MPKVSVVIPCYNVEKYLRQCLDSVVNQTFKDIEIICVNDCSPDNLQKILEEYEQKDNRISIVVNEKNLGLGMSRNRAIPLTNSDYILFIDSDDWLELNAIEELYSAITETDANVAYFNFREVHENSNKCVEVILKNTLSKYGVLLEHNKIFTNYDIRHICFRKVPNLTWYKMYKKSFLTQNNIEFAPYKYEDNVFLIKLKILSKKNVYVNRVFYNYRIQPDSIMRTSKIPFWELYNDINNLLIELNEKEALIDGFNEYVMQNAIFSMKKMGLVEKIKFKKEVDKVLDKSVLKKVNKAFLKYVLKDIFFLNKKKYK